MDISYTATAVIQVQSLTSTGSLPLSPVEDISTWTQKDLKKGTYYKYVVKAYRLVNGKKVVTDTSISVHAVTGGGKYGNAKSCFRNPDWK